MASMFTVGFSNSPATDQDHVLLKVGRGFLYFGPRGDPELSRAPSFHSPYNDSQRYLFDFEKDSLPSANNCTDSACSVQWPSYIIACWHGRRYHLCARFNTDVTPPTKDVYFDEIKNNPAGAVWLRTEISFGEYILESKIFPGYCLTNQDGRLCLRRKNKRGKDNRVWEIHLSREMVERSSRPDVVIRTSFVRTMARSYGSSLDSDGNEHEDSNERSERSSSRGDDDDDDEDLSEVLTWMFACMTQ